MRVSEREGGTAVLERPTDQQVDEFGGGTGSAYMVMDSASNQKPVHWKDVLNLRGEKIRRKVGSDEPGWLLFRVPEGKQESQYSEKVVGLFDDSVLTPFVDSRRKGFKFMYNIRGPIISDAHRDPQTGEWHWPFQIEVLPFVTEPHPDEEVFGTNFINPLTKMGESTTRTVNPPRSDPIALKDLALSCARDFVTRVAKNYCDRNVPPIPFQSIRIEAAARYQERSHGHESFSMVVN